jgi:hypothetical protein
MRVIRPSRVSNAITDTSTPDVMATLSLAVVAVFAAALLMISIRLHPGRDWLSTSAAWAGANS